MCSSYYAKIVSIFSKGKYTGLFQVMEPKEMIYQYMEYQGW